MPDAPDELIPPEDFGAEIRALFESNKVRSFDPNSQRVTSDPVAGITAADGGATVDSFEQLANQLNTQIVADRSPVTAPVTELPTPSPDATEPASQPASVELPAPVPLPPPSDPTAAQPPPTVDGRGAEPPGAPVATEPQHPSSGWTLTSPDGSQTLPDEQVRLAFALSEWANNLPDNTRQAIAAIEDGQGVVIPRADFDQFTAWRNQQSRSSRDRDLDSYDPDAAAEITRLRDEVAQLQQSTQSLQSPSNFTNLNNNLDNTAALYDRAITSYRTSRQLTEPEFNAVMEVALKNRFIEGVASSNAVWNPVTHQLLRPADPSIVVPQALDAALALNPGLHESVLNRLRTQSPTPTPIANPSPSPSPVATPAAAQSPGQPDPVIAKRARAASVAAAPSGAVPPTPRAIKTFTNDELVRSMAAELAPLFGHNDDQLNHVSAPTVL